MKPTPFSRRASLSDGYDAADLLAAGARAGALPPLRFVQQVLDAPAVVAGERPKGIPSGVYHQLLVDHLNAELEARGIEPDAADGWRRRGSGKLASISNVELAQDIWFNLLADDGIAADHVQRVVMVLARRGRDQRRKTLIERFTGKPATAAGSEALVGWVQAVTGRVDPTDVKVVAHWLWLVKRLTLERHTEHDLMPIIYGPQASGKSTATARLVQPLEELATTINAATLTDERRYRQLAVFLVGRWEEMQGAARSDIESLKHTVTTPTLVYRELATHTMVTLRRTASFIGTSNNSVDTMVGDTTGARRFYQLTTPERCDHEAINRIDPALVWQAVSEDDAAPILDVLQVVRANQAELVHRDAVTMWLESETWAVLTVHPIDQHEPITIPPYAPARGEPWDHVAARFKHWCQLVGQTNIGLKELAKRLRQEGFTTSRPGTGLHRIRHYHRPGERCETRPAADGPTSPAGAGEDKTPRFARMASPPDPREDALGEGGDGALAF